MTRSPARPFTLAAAFCLFIAGHSPGEIAVKSGETVAFLGDSITQGGWSDPKGYVRLVVAGLAANGVEITPVPAGISGHKSNNMLDRLERDVLAKKPQWMTMSCGVNDVWHGAKGVPLDAMQASSGTYDAAPGAASVGTYVQNITAIVSRAQAAGVRPVILTSTVIKEDLASPENQRLAPYNDFLRALAKERSLPFADLHAMCAERIKAANTPGKNVLTSDGVHMKAEGNRVMATGVLRAFGLDDAQLAKAEAAWTAPASVPKAAESAFTPIFDGKTLAGWRVSAKSGHSGKSGNTTGGRWEVKDGAITGTQDLPGNGGLLLTDELYSEVEVALEMNNDFGPDSGLFLRSTEEGKCYQALVDYHPGGSLMGIYGEGLGGKPHLRFFSFGATPDTVTLHPDRTPSPMPIADEAAWRGLWKAGQWNELRARMAGGDKPVMTTWINGVKIMEWTETEARLPLRGHIALQIHGGGKPEDYEGKFVRYRNIRVKRLDPAP